MDDEELKAYRALLPARIPAEIAVVAVRQPTPVDLRLLLSDGSHAVLWRQMPGPETGPLDGWVWGFGTAGKEAPAREPPAQAPS